MSYNCNGNFGGYGGGYGGCGGGYGGGYGGGNEKEKKREEEDEIRELLKHISIGTCIRVHFDCTSRRGKFLGIHKGSVLIVSRNVPIYIPVRKVLAIDLVGCKC